MAKILPTRYEALAFDRDARGNLRLARRIPQRVAAHHPQLTDRIQNPNGQVRIRPKTELSTVAVKIDGVEYETSITIPATHPDGNRLMRRRARQRHKPEFTKTTHPGRSWVNS